MTHMNLIEIHQTLLRLFSEKDADEATIKLEHMVVVPTIANILNASKFRLKHKKKNLSYTDCVGYIIAQDMKIKFLTGDKEFKNLPNVEFVQ